MTPAPPVGYRLSLSKLGLRTSDRVIWSDAAELCGFFSRTGWLWMRFFCAICLEIFDAG